MSRAARRWGEDSQAARRRGRRLDGGGAVRGGAGRARGARDPSGARGGTDVVCDRFLDSSLAYQGVARGLGIDRVLELNVAVADLTPHRTFVLLLDAEVAAARAGSSPDRMEREDGTFRAAVADGYRQLAERFPDRIVVLDGSQPMWDVAARRRGTRC